MDPLTMALTVGGALGVMGALVGTLVLASRPKSRPWTRTDRRMMALADAYDGLRCDLGSFVQYAHVEGVVDGVSLRVTLLDSTDLAGSVLEIAMTAPAALSEGSVWPAGVTAPGPETGALVRTGDAAFDEQVQVRSVRPDAVLAHLSADVRAALLRDPPWRLQFGQWTCRVSRVPDETTLADLVARGLALARCTRLDDGEANALERMVDDDPVPGVRRRALEARLALGRPTVARLEAWAAGDDMAAVRAAEALGDDGAAHLARQLDGEAAGHAALVWSRRAVPPALLPRVEAALLRQLDDGPNEWTNEALHALGRVATTRVVPELRAREGGATSGRIREAIREIQARAEGAEVGQVSLVEGGAAGGLSMAAAATLRGRVSDAER